MENQRDYILVYINGQRQEIRGKQAFLTLSDYLRSEEQLTGTKLVCAEGDCGACTVLAASVIAGNDDTDIVYKSINSCIVLMHSLDCSQVISIEGLNAIYQDKLHPIQSSMIDCHGTQCGFCTPGFVMSIAAMLEEQTELTEKNARNHLTGNLCRCTGYQQIINSVTTTDTNKYATVKKHYHSSNIHSELLAAAMHPVSLSYKENSFNAVINMESAIEQLNTQPQQLFSAATDLGVQINKGHIEQQNALSLHLIAELYEFKLTPEYSSVGARITLSDLRSHIKDKHPEFCDFLNIFASPQIKNNATLVGNIANGSPIADTLPFLMAMDASLVIHGPYGVRKCNINNFYLGYKQLDLASAELISHVEIPHKAADTQLKLYKVSQRRDLDISCVSAAFKMQFDKNDMLIDAAIALGGVAATAVRLTAVEKQLTGLSRQEIYSPTLSNKIATLISDSLRPLTDVRGSEKFRKVLVANLYRKFIDETSTNFELSSADEV